MAAPKNSGGPKRGRGTSKKPTKAMQGKDPSPKGRRGFSVGMTHEGLISNLLTLTTNGQIMSRSRMARMMGQTSDEFRDVKSNCFYPESSSITSHDFRERYDRNPFAARSVGLLPDESWMVPPEIYEDEDEDVTTQFEQALKDVSDHLRGEANWYDPQENQGDPLFEILQRVDVLSGIGSFGILLLGFDDIGVGSTKTLADPVDFVVTERKPKKNPDQPQKKTDVPDAPEASQDSSQEDPPEDSADEESSGDQFTEADFEDDEEVAQDSGDQQQDPQSDKNPSAKKDQGDTQDAQVAQDGLKPKTPQKGSVIPPKFDSEDMAASDTPPKWVGKRKLLFVRAFDQSSVDISEWDWDPSSPRYGMPKKYLVTFGDWRNNAEAIGEPANTVTVHWSRVIHVADCLTSSEVIGASRMRTIYDRLLDLERLYGCASEGYWQGALPGLTFTTHPQLGGEVEIDENEIKEGVEKYTDSLQKHLIGRGLEIGTLAPNVVDPTPHIKAAILAICVYFGCPERIFMGSERGELASGQDKGTWNDRLSARQKKHITPRIIIPVLNRLIQVGVLPEPEQYKIVWQDLNTVSDDVKAGIAVKRAQALASFVGGNIESIMTRMDFLTVVMGMTSDEAQQIEENQDSLMQERLTPDPMEQMQLDHEAKMLAAENPAPIVPGGPPGKNENPMDKGQNPQGGPPKKPNFPGGLPQKKSLDNPK